MCDKCFSDKCFSDSVLTYNVVNVVYSINRSINRFRCVGSDGRVACCKIPVRYRR